MSLRCIVLSCEGVPVSLLGTFPLFAFTEPLLCGCTTMSPASILRDAVPG